MGPEISTLLLTTMFVFAGLVLLVTYNIATGKGNIPPVGDLLPYIGGVIRFENNEAFIVRDVVQHEDMASVKIFYAEEDGGFNLVVVERRNYSVAFFEPNILAFKPENTEHRGFILTKKH